MERQKVLTNSCTQCPEGFRTKFTFLFTLFFLVAIEDVISQKIWEERKGCIRTQGNLAGGYLFSQKIATAYITGDMDVFVEDRVGVAGSIWASFATNRKNEVGVKANHAVFWGINYHFLKPKRFDPFIGLTPGVGLVRVVFKNGDAIKQTPFTVVPLVSATLGFNYYVGSIFNFFAKVQGVTGHVTANMPSPVRLEELKFTAGLGWNLRLWKPKIKDKWKAKSVNG